MKRLISILLPLIGLALFAFIVKSTGPSRIIDTFRLVSPREIAISLVLVIVITVVRGVRWRYLMSVVGIHYTLARATMVWTIGFFASAVTPAKVGDAVRVFYVRNDTGRSFGEAFLTVFIDRLWDLFFILVAGVVTVLAYSRLYTQIPSVWILIIAVVAIVGVITVALRRDMMKRILRPLFNMLIPERHKDKLSINFNSFYDALRDYGRGWKQHVVAGLLTILCWGLIFGLAFYIACSLDLDIAPGYLALIWPIITLVELVPVSISGLGTRDATMIYFFSLVGLTSAQAVGFSLAYLLIGTYMTALFGFIFWLRLPVSFSGD